jgi:hypothetical protein
MRANSLRVLAPYFAFAVLLAACGSSRDGAQTHLAVSTDLPASGPSKAPLSGTLPSTVSGGGTSVVIGNGQQYSPLEGQQITPVEHRNAGAIALRTFVTKLGDYSVNCDPTTQQCVPAWCEQQGLFVVELSDPAMVATQMAGVIGLDDGSKLSLLSSAVVGSAEGSPAQVVTVRAAPDVAKVELSTPGGVDEEAPKNGLAALAVAGSGASATLRALDAEGQPLQTLAVSDVPTAQTAACQPRPIQLPKAGTPPADPKTAETAIRAAYTAAYQHTDGAAPYAALEHVEDGQALQTTVDLARKNFPEAANTITVTTGDLVFTSPTTAVIQYTLNYTGGAPFGTQNGKAVLINGSWLVGRATYCSLLGFGGATCPPA